MGVLEPTLAGVKHQGQLPTSAGVSIKPAHFDELIQTNVNDLWFEVHPENYMVDGGARLASIQNIAEQFPLSLHGVGASLGGPELPSAKHIKQLKQLIERLQPACVSEHAVWSTFRGVYYADLFPLPRTNVAMQQLIDGIDCFQNGIGRTILIENPSNYLPVISEMDEADFLVEAAQKSGAGLLLDVNNLYISQQNCGLDTRAYLEAIPNELVGEIHVAGFSSDPNFGASLLIDSHDQDVDIAVWQLLDTSLALLGPKPVLLERDSNLPSYLDLLKEREIAQHSIDRALESNTKLANDG